MAWLVLKRYAADKNQAIICIKIDSNSNFNLDILQLVYFGYLKHLLVWRGYLECFKKIA